MFISFNYMKNYESTKSNMHRPRQAIVGYPIKVSKTFKQFFVNCGEGGRKKKEKKESK